MNKGLKWLPAPQRLNQKDYKKKVLHSLVPSEVAGLVEAAGGCVQEVEQVIVLQVVEVRLDQVSASAARAQRGNKVNQLASCDCADDYENSQRHGYVYLT